MNEDAFARRFYADRAELESLGIQLTVDQPVDGVAEQENYSLRPENFHLPRDRVHRRRARLAADRAHAARRRVRLRRAAAPGAAADLLGPAQPAARARPARASRSASPARPAATTSPSAWRRSRRRSSATRRSPSTTTRWSATRSGARKVDPYHLLFQGGQFYLLGRSHERDALRVFRLSRIRGKVAYATKAEHDFKRPSRLRPARATPTAPSGSSATPIGDGRGLDLRAHRLAGRAPLRPLRRDRAGRGRRASSAPRYANAAPARVLGAGARRARPRASGRPSWSTSVAERVELLGRAPRPASPSCAGARRAARRGGRRRRRRPTSADGDGRARGRDPPRALRAARHARLDPHRGRARGPARCRSTRCCERLQISEPELREDVSVLNVVNFGGGSYVLYAEVDRRRLRSRSTPSPTRTTSRAPRGCCRSRPRRSSPRST